MLLRERAHFALLDRQAAVVDDLAGLADDLLEEVLEYEAAPTYEPKATEIYGRPAIEFEVEGYRFRVRRNGTEAAAPAILEYMVGATGHALRSLADLGERLSNQPFGQSQR